MLKEYYQINQPVMWKNVFLESCLLSALIFAGFYLNATLLKDELYSSDEKPPYLNHISGFGSEGKPMKHISGIKQDKENSPHISGFANSPKAQK